MTRLWSHDLSVLEPLGTQLFPLYPECSPTFCSSAGAQWVGREDAGLGESKPSQRRAGQLEEVV